MGDDTVHSCAALWICRYHHKHPDPDVTILQAVTLDVSWS